MAREALVFYKQSVRGVHVRLPRVRPTAKTVHTRHPPGKVDLIGNWVQGGVCYTVRENFGEDRSNCDGLINLLEEVSRWPSIEAMVWLLLAALGQVHRENQEQNAE